MKSLSNNVVTGKTPSKKHNEFYDKGTIPFIKIPDMHGKTYIINTSEKLTKVGANSQSKKYIPKNSIIVSCIGSPGLVSLTSKESQTNQQINSILLSQDIIYPIFLELQRLKQYIINLGSGGTTINNLNKINFENITLNLPSLGVLEKFNKKITPLFIELLNNEYENEKLSQIKCNLLNKFF
ncbi:restriction endonuclease subunit S [Limosilactobacillus reuteri]|uniref:restriction endonuclease subunit S n=1 Tax=Limosilactobacillus reuteri TaxID=1598 RepID=UPI001CDB7086|nr:restriction endonuclease subunit S [Limosilactobacillus reuteri]MCH5384960.1 restriction endonuclease subunit S [Limosilactobacillus reuteri]